MHNQCAACDVAAASEDDPIFDDCKRNNHEIVEMLDSDKISNEIQLKESHKKDNHAVATAESLPHALTNLNKKIESLFPGRSFAVIICLVVKAQMLIDGVTQVFTLIVMGNPSSYKSTVLEIIASLPDSYVSDSFTPKSFVSHSANSKKKDLEKVDLLPRIRHKTLITPELAPLFSGNQDQLVEYFGMLTRILDGRGFQSDSGVHGSRGYLGDYSFTWLGAVVDIPHRVWKLLGNLGPKIYFLRLPSDQKSGKDKVDQIKQLLKGNSYSTKLEACKDVVKEFWKLIQDLPKQNGKIVWDKENDDDATLDKIIHMSILLSKLRATVPTWHTSESDSGGANYNFETPITEEPSRASNALYNLARGYAVINGRNSITHEDLKVVIPVVLSSAPKERVELFKLLIENNGTLNTNEFIEAAGVSRATARKEMEKLVKIGLVDKTEEEAETKPVIAVTLKSEFSWFLSTEFLGYWSEFKALLISQNSKLSSGKGENLEKNGVSTVQEGSVRKIGTLEAYGEAQK